MSVTNLGNDVRLIYPGQKRSLHQLALENYGAFGFTTSVIPNSVIELNAAYPISLLRDNTFESGSGSVTQVNAEYRLRHTTGGDVAVIESSQRGRYVPGYEAAAGIGVRLDGAIAGDTSAEWGYFDRDPANDKNIEDGAVFGVDSGGLYARVVRGGTEVHKAYRSTWNVDTLKDFDPLNDASGTIYEVRFVYYGYGLIQFIINVGNTGDLQQRGVTVHTYQPAAAPVLNNPNLKVGAIVKSTTGTDDLDVFIGGRKFHTLGDWSPKSRVTSYTRIGLATSTTVVPVMSFRRKADRRATTIQPFGASVLPSTEDVILSIRIGSTLTGASFGAIPEQPAGETSLELDTSASAIDTATGTKIFEGAYAAGQAKTASTGAIDRIVTDIPDEEIVSFCVRSTTGTGTVTVTGRMEEEY